MCANFLKSFFALVIISNFAFSQQFGTWENYSSMRDVNDIYILENGIWSATNGGIFFYNFNDSSFSLVNKSKSSEIEFSVNQVTAITVDNYGKVWAGNQNGFIYVFDQEESIFRRIGDIYVSDKTKKQITNLVVKGDSIFAATEFGFSIIDGRNYSFYDSYFKLGNLATDVKVNDLLINNGNLVLSTEAGIVIQKPNATNLNNPNSWDTYTSQNGLPSNNVLKTINYNDQLIALTDNGVRVLQNGVWNQFLPQLNSIPVLDGLVDQNVLYLLTPNQVYSFDNQNFELVAENYGLRKLSYKEGKGFFAASNHFLIDLNNGKEISPNGPKANLFASMDVDKDGTLWVATGKDVTGIGFYRFDGLTWQNYDVLTNPEITTNAMWRVYVAPDNTKYFGSWGAGFISYQNGNVKSYSAQNTDFVGIPANPDFVVIQGFDVDSKGNLWVLNYWTLTRENLVKITPDSTYEFFQDPINTVEMYGYDIVIDENDTKWLSLNSKESSSGNALYYFNEERPLYSSNINGWGYLSLSDLSGGTQINSINSIVIDNRNELWIGTSNGIRIITNTLNPRNSISPTKPLPGQIINYIAVDPLNQKWVATQQGVFLLSSDGLKILANYDVNNSPLPSNDVKNIAIDEKSGVIYFGTDFGLASLKTFSVNPKSSLDDLTVYPNPIIINENFNSNIVIEGLVRDSDIKILSISGKVLRTFTTPGGGTAIWDGKDENGELISSGIYLILAFDKEGNNVGVTKAAVIRK